MTLYSKGVPNDFSPEIPNAGHAALLLDPVTDWKWGHRQVGACSLPKQLAGRCALGRAAWEIVSAPRDREKPGTPTLE